MCLEQILPSFLPEMYQGEVRLGKKWGVETKPLTQEWGSGGQSS